MVKDDARLAAPGFAVEGALALVRGAACSGDVTRRFAAVFSCDIGDGAGGG